MQIESIINFSIEEALANNYKIVNYTWGIANLNDKWVCNGVCCPLGAVLLKHQLIFDDSYFSQGMAPHENLKNVRFNPTYPIVKLFNVDVGWVKSFWHGLLDSHIGYYSSDYARQLGYQYYHLFK